MKFTDLLDQAFDAKACPLSSKLFLSRKFVLPSYRAPDYYPQDETNRMALMNLILLTMPDVENKVDEVTRGCVGNVMLACSCGRPTLFLERELGDILLASHLPEDLDTSDIKRPFPSLRIMLPRGLLSLERDGASMMFIDIGFLEGKVDLRCPRDIAAELDLNSLKRFGPGPGRMWLSKTSFGYDETCVLVTGTLDHGESEYSPTAYGITKPWKDGPVSILRQYRGKLQTDWPTDQTDDVLLAKMESLALNILLLLSRVPVEYEPLHIERKERTEGKRIIPALLRAKWVGDCLMRARRDGYVRGQFVNGFKMTAHWVSPHWRRVPCGPRRSERRLIWILPYRSGAEAA